MTASKYLKNGRIPATLIAALFVVSAFVGPGSALLPIGDDGDFEAAVHSNDFSFNLTTFEQRAPAANGDWVAGPDDAVVQNAHSDISFLVTDAAQVGGPAYRDVTYTGIVTAPDNNNNIFGFVLGQELPTGAGMKVDSYVLDWAGGTQTAFGHTKTEGFTLYHIEGELPPVGDATLEDQLFACYWAKDDAACTSATITVLNTTSTGPGEGWVQNQAYHFELAHSADQIALSVDGVVKVDEVGSFPEVANFGLMTFRQSTTAWSDLGFLDVTAPAVTVDTQCAVEGESGWCVDALEYRVSVEEHGSGLIGSECSIDGGAAGACPSVFTAAPVGETQVDASANDTAQNVGVASAALKFDPDGPTNDHDFRCQFGGNELTGTIWGDVCGGVEDARLIMRGLASDDVSGLNAAECSLDGAVQTNCGFRGRTVDGFYEYSIDSDDVAGNVNNTTQLYLLDRTPYDVEVVRTDCLGGEYVDPDSGILYCGDDLRVRARDIHVFGTTRDTRECTVNGDPLACGNRWHTEHGPKEIAITTTDLIGNTNATSGTFFVDKELPDFEAPACFTMTFPGNVCRSEVVIGDLTSADSGIAEQNCAVRADHLGETEFTARDCDDPLDEDGVYTVYVNATSNVGHFNETTWSFELDLTAPQIAFVSPVPGVSYLNGDEHDCLVGLSYNLFGVTGSTPTCLAMGTLEAILVADDPSANNHTTGIDRVEFWDGVRGNLFKVHTIEGDGDNGTYTFSWDTTNAPSPSEPHYFQTRTLQARIWDVAGNFNTAEFSIYVLPPVL